MFADLLSLDDGLKRTNNKPRYPVSCKNLNKMCYLQFVGKCFVHDIFSFHHSCISIVLMHNPSFFFLFFAQLCYGFLPHEPTNWKFKRLKFCTFCTNVYSHFHLPTQTNDLLSPLTPQRAEEEGKRFAPHTTTKIESMGEQQAPEGTWYWVGQSQHSF